MFKIQKDILLAPYTRYNIGGLAKYFCEVGNKGEIIKALDFAHKQNIPVFILGGGTNALISDKGFDGLVIKVGEREKIQILNNYSSVKVPPISYRGNLQLQIKSKCQNLKIRVGAGTLLSDVISFALKNGLQGLEWAAGIPGTIGGAVRGNAGAFGGEMASIVESVKVIVPKINFYNDNNVTKSQITNLKLQINNKFQTPKQQLRKTDYELRELTNKNLNFGYRTSIIKERGGMIVLSATLKLRRITNNEAKTMNKEKVEKYIKYRKEHHPLEYPSCGSVFKNIERENIKKNRELLENIKNKIIPVAILISKTGLCGRKIGGAQISKKHCNFIINLGNAKAKDVYDLIKLCQREVYKKFGVKLKLEVKIVGKH